MRRQTGPAVFSRFFTGLLHWIFGFFLRVSVRKACEKERKRLTEAWRRGIILPYRRQRFPATDGVIVEHHGEAGSKILIHWPTVWAHLYSLSNEVRVALLYFGGT